MQGSQQGQDSTSDLRSNAYAVRVLPACQRPANAGLGVRPVCVRLFCRREMISTVLQTETARQSVTANCHADLRRHAAEECVTWVFTLPGMGIKCGTGRVVTGSAREHQGASAGGLRRHMFDRQRTVGQICPGKNLEVCLPLVVVDLEAKGACVLVRTRLRARHTENDLRVLPCGYTLKEPTAPRFEADRHPIHHSVAANDSGLLAPGLRREETAEQDSLKSLE